MAEVPIETQPLEQFQKWTELAGRGQQMMLEFLAREPGPPASDPMGMMATWQKATLAAMADPQKLIDLQGRYVADAMTLWQSFLSPETVRSPVGEIKDKRFAGDAWRENPAFDFLRQSYLLASNYTLEATAGIEGMDAKDKAKAQFLVKQYVDAISPSNFLATNPEVLKKTAESGGSNLIKGLEHLLGDLEAGRMKMTDENAFEVGRNVAITPGKVVFENRLFQLIQYSPTTAKVYETPLLIFPPWINKFYILDLQPENSMIRWLSSQGFTVFVCSWVNPDVDKAGLGFDDYLEKGIYRCVEKALEQSKAEHINTVGYCIGGTLMGAALAHMAAKGDKRVTANTFFAAQHDFAEAGDLLLFTDEHWLGEVEQQMDAAGGVLPGAAMAETFNALRANDLIWSFFVSNYLMGKSPPAFDLLFWNADQTRMPKTLHMDYLRSMYGQNKLARGEFTIGGIKVDLSKVTIPLYFQASREDHIAPMNSVYRSARAFSNADVTLTLAGSGHIAGVVNPPSAKKYQHWTNPALPATLGEWQAKAAEHPGSWWTHWADWLHEKSGDWIAARDPKTGPLKPIEPAPGSYVKVKS